MKNITPNQLTFMLAPFVMALALGMDVYVPAIPKLTELFQVSDNIMLLTLSLFMLTAGVMQLFVGPLSDHFGRKKVAYLAIIIFSVGCILCSMSQGHVLLIIGRIIQSVGSCGMMVIGFTIVRDCFEGDKSAKVYSYLNGMISFSPMFAPFIGSYLDIYLGWQSIFISLLLIAILAWIVLKFYLPETLPSSEKVPLNIQSILYQCRITFTHPVFAIYNLATCFGLTYLYLFCALSPYLIIRNLNIPESQYGFYFFYMGVSFFIGSMICSQIVEKLGIYTTCFIGFIITLIGGVWMAAWFYQSGLSLNGFIYPMLLVGIGGTFCLGAGTGGLMWPFSHNTGTAAALGGTLRFCFASLAGMAVINDEIASTLPLGIPAILFSIIGLGLFIAFRKKLILKSTPAS